MILIKNGKRISDQKAFHHKLINFSITYIFINHKTDTCMDKADGIKIDQITKSGSHKHEICCSYQQY